MTSPWTSSGDALTLAMRRKRWARVIYVIGLAWIRWSRLLSSYPQSTGQMPSTPCFRGGR